MIQRAVQRFVAGRALFDERGSAGLKRSPAVAGNVLDRVALGSFDLGLHGLGWLRPLAQQTGRDVVTVHRHDADLGFPRAIFGQNLDAIESVALIDALLADLIAAGMAGPNCTVVRPPAEGEVAAAAAPASATPPSTKATG